MSMDDRGRDRSERERPERDPRGSADRDRRHLRDTLEDDLDLIRGAPRDRALHILRILLEAVYGEGYIRANEERMPPASQRTGTSMSASSSD